MSELKGIPQVHVVSVATGVQDYIMCALHSYPRPQSVCISGHDDFCCAIRHIIRLESFVVDL